MTEKDFETGVEQQLGDEDSQPAQPSGNSPETADLKDARRANPNIRSLRDLIDHVTGRNLKGITAEEDSGIAEVWPFPFLALVGQMEMKLGLLLALINPAVGGVLLIGPRGTGKTTAVRSLIDLLPAVWHSRCHYGCMPEDIEAGGMDAVCPDCAAKFARDEPLAALEPVRLIELPLNARIDDVIGGIDESLAANDRRRVRRGILAQSDRNLLYVDEVNLLTNEVVDAILDASAQGRYTVRRGPVSATYYSRFTLVGTMNPEEGNLRPQMLDRFGLRLLVRGLPDSDERLEAYRRTQAHLANPRRLVDLYADETMIARDEIQSARDLLPEVELPDKVAQDGLALVKSFGIASLRAEITLFEAARAHAAADGRKKVSVEDLRQVAPLALRLRRSEFINQYFENQQSEEEEISQALAKLSGGAKAKKKAKPVPKKAPSKKKSRTTPKA
jgi:magnesium chelatase subunit I